MSAIHETKVQSVWIAFQSNPIDERIYEYEKSINFIFYGYNSFQYP